MCIMGLNLNAFVGIKTMQVVNNAMITDVNAIATGSQNNLINKTSLACICPSSHVLRALKVANYSFSTLAQRAMLATASDTYPDSRALLDLS